jgi:hypothetical protein
MKNINKDITLISTIERKNNFLGTYRTCFIHGADLPGNHNWFPGMQVTQHIILRICKI